VDTDSDGSPDFRDLDSDNDCLEDRWEFENGLDPRDPDSDDDGLFDLIEVAVGSDPLDSSSTPRSLGITVILVPYAEVPIPPDEIVVLGPTTSGPGWLSVELVDDTSDTVDAVASFVERVQPNVLGGEADPSDPTMICVGGLAVEDRVAPFDGQPDSFSSVDVGTVVCFDMEPAVNLAVPATDEIQVFECDMNLVGPSGVHDTQQITFIVPPVCSY
jgi:hypothetical protein